MDKLLAPELWQEIFKYLKRRDITSVRLVCKHWRNASFLPSLTDNVPVLISDSNVCDISPLITSGFSVSNLNFKSTSKESTYSTVPFWTHFGASLRTLVLNSISFDENVNLPKCLEYCPNLKSLSLEHCRGLGVGIHEYVANLELKEFRVFCCPDMCSWIVPLVSSLAPRMSKFEFTWNANPNLCRYLRAAQLIDIFRLASKTLTEVDITWCVRSNKIETEVQDCDLIFGAPGLRLKKVSVICNFKFTEIASAVVAHHGKWLEEIKVGGHEPAVYVSGALFFDPLVSAAFKQLKWYLAQDLPKLRKFTCGGYLSNTHRTELLRFLLHHTAELDTNTTLREIVVDNMVHLVRNTSSDKFIPKEILLTFDQHELVERTADVVRSFLQQNSMQLLTKLHITNLDLSQNGIFNVIMTNCQKLVELNLERCNLTDGLLMNENVTDALRMNGIKVRYDKTDFEWDAILKNSIFPIMNLTRLESLALVNCGPLTSFSVSRVIKFPNLKSLQLSKMYSLCDSRFPLLALNNPSLEVANFAGTRLRNYAIIEFSRNSQKLVELNIKNNEFLTNLTLRRLTKHNGLKQLNVEGCRRITANSIRAARKRNTALTIVE